MNGSLTDGSRVRLAVSEAGFQTQSNPIKPYQRTRCLRHRQRQPGARGAQGGTQGRGSTRGITESRVRAGERLTTASRIQSLATSRVAHVSGAGSSRRKVGALGHRHRAAASLGGCAEGHRRSKRRRGHRQPINSAVSAYRGQAPQWRPKRRRQGVAAKQPYT